MKFVIAENIWDRIGTLGYRGVIGLFYDNTLFGLLSYLIFGIVAILTIIGAITVLKYLFHRKPKKQEFKYFKN